jgi:hypothetical protein
MLLYKHHLFFEHKQTKISVQRMIFKVKDISYTLPERKSTVSLRLYLDNSFL